MLNGVQMYASIKISIEVPVYPERVYQAWLDGYEHARFTSLPAQINGKAGEGFSTLGGRVTGTITNLSPFDRIVQTWRATDFPDNDPDSEIELKLEPTCTGSLVTLTHKGVNASETRQVMQWWQDVYLRPLRDFFDDLVGDYVADMGDG